MFRKLGLSVVHLARRFVSVTGTKVRRGNIHLLLFERTSQPSPGRTGSPKLLCDRGFHFAGTFGTSSLG
jgi:hypothetical protein